MSFDVRKMWVRTYLLYMATLLPKIHVALQFRVLPDLADYRDSCHV